MKKKVIIDCDAGVDDALYILINAPRITICGVFDFILIRFYIYYSQEVKINKIELGSSDYLPSL